MFGPATGSGHAQAADLWRHIPLTLTAHDVIPTGNDWIALPDINPSDGSLGSFNVLSMRDRGLLSVTGDRGTAALKPAFLLDGKPLHTPPAYTWNLLEYWIPQAHFAADGLEGTLTYVAPPDSRAAFLKMTVTNRRAEPAKLTMALDASWGALNRVTYTAVALKGERTTVPAPWTDIGRVFAFVTSDTHFAWSLLYPGATAVAAGPPVSMSPGAQVMKEVTLAPGASAETHFVIGVGLEEYSATQSAQALEESIDREGTDKLIDETAAWCKQRTRSTGRADLDVLMNRNFLFTALYAWGRSLDTEQLVGVTSRSERYYVSAAYWDRDALLWSFPGLLDVDPARAREALQYALTVQRRNGGTHSRFIDGVVLEDGFQLDEFVAPVVAMGQYIARTGDEAFLLEHQAALASILERLEAHRKQPTGLYATLQDPQDQYRKQEFNTYDNALVWRALLAGAELDRRLHDSAGEKDLRRRAAELHAAVLKTSVVAGAKGASGTIFASATDGEHPIFADGPPGSLLRLPQLGFVPEDDPTFVRTYEWLHSPNYDYSFMTLPYGFPGSYRLPFTAVWTVPDHLRLKAGRDKALTILTGTAWDGGIISEGFDSKTGIVDHDGRAFATAAGYVAHAICEIYCTDRKP